MKQQSKQINFKLDEHLYNKLKEFAKGEKKSVQYILTESLISMMARSEQPENRSGRFTFIDLFAGIGGMRIAFERQEGVCVFSSEWDKYAQKTYFDNFDVLPQGDITKIRAQDIPDHDVLVAGFPCQPFSIAGVSKKTASVGLLAFRIRRRERYSLMFVGFWKPNGRKHFCWKM